MVNSLISVVIPTYRRPHLLAQCLRALAGQTLHAALFDVIVVSDGIDEASKKIVLAQDAQAEVTFHYLHTAVRNGPAAARNLGWLFSQSPLIAFTDDDCLPASTWLEDIIHAYRGEKKIAFTGTVAVPISSPPSDYEKNIAGLEKAEFITANCACTKEALYIVGGFDERFQQAWREDSDLHFKLVEAQIPIIPLDGALVTHPVRAADWGISIRDQKKGLYNALLFKKFPDLYRRRIGNRSSFFYDLLLLLMLLICWAGLRQRYRIMAFLLFTWGLLTSLFVAKRLKDTSRSTGHVLEMIVTSPIIPYLALYWKVYGVFKFRAFKFLLH